MPIGNLEKCHCNQMEYCATVTGVTVSKYVCLVIWSFLAGPTEDHISDIYCRCYIQGWAKEWSLGCVNLYQLPE